MWKLQLELWNMNHKLLNRTLIRHSLKGWLPQHILVSKAKQLYEEYCIRKAEAGEEPEKLKITKKWLQKWCKDYNISLKYTNKQFSITKEVWKNNNSVFKKCLDCQVFGESKIQGWPSNFISWSKKVEAKSQLTFLEATSPVL